MDIFKTLVYSSVLFLQQKVPNFNFGFLKNYKNLQLWFNLECTKFDGFNKDFHCKH